MRGITRIYISQHMNDLYDSTGYIGEEDTSWVGYDLDRTLVSYDGWQGADHIGDDMDLVCEKMAKDLLDGKRVKIFTARCSDETGLNSITSIDYITAWSWIKFGVKLEITNVKDTRCVKLYDDIAINVNNGKINK
jgi:hypothetical protein